MKNKGEDMTKESKPVTTGIKLGEMRGFLERFGRTLTDQCVSDLRTFDQILKNVMVKEIGGRFTIWEARILCTVLEDFEYDYMEYENLVPLIVDKVELYFVTDEFKKRYEEPPENRKVIRSRFRNDLNFLSPLQGYAILELVQAYNYYKPNCQTQEERIKAIKDLFMIPLEMKELKDEELEILD